MINKVKNILTIKNILYFSFFIICFLLFIFDLNSEKHNSCVYLLFGLFTIFIITIIILFNYKFKKINYSSYHKFYALVVLVFGVILIAITPPFMGSDEQTHFFRIYEISEGHLISQTDENGTLATMPRSLNKAYSGYDNENIYDEDRTISYDKIPSRLEIPLNKDDVLNYSSYNRTNYSGASLYSPIQYLPHLVGVETGKILNLGPILIVYLIRICNLLAFSALTIIGIKLLPKFKLPAMLILLSPVVLSGATTVSADGITNAIIFIFIAYIINLIYNKSDIRVKEKIILSLMVFLISMCKIVYFPIIVLIFLIPNVQFKNNKDNWIFKITLFIFGILLSLSWLYIASTFMNAQSNTSEQQISFILSHPLEFLFIIIRTYISNFDENITNLFFGNQMYHWSLNVYSLFSVAYVLVIVFSLFTEKTNIRLSNKATFLIISIGIAILGLMAAALFVQNNTSISNIISGIQARYFIPLCFLGILLLKIKKIKFRDKMIFSVFILLYFPTFLTIVVRFI